MPNPLYTPKQRGRIRLYVSQLFLASICLASMKLAKHPFVAGWSWWKVLSPVWVPVAGFVLIVLICGIIYGIRMDRQRVAQHLSDMEEKNPPSKATPDAQKDLIRKFRNQEN